MQPNRIIRAAAAFTAALLLSAASPFKRDPVVHYTLRLDVAANAFDVEMRVKGAPYDFKVAMNAHPEYDDKYWRYLTDLRVECPKTGASATRADSSLWSINLPGGEGTIRYRIALPRPEAGNRSAWKPFLTPTGGLTGGPQTFLYIVGAERVASAVTLDIPRGWNIATELESTSDPRTFYAKSVAALVEGPIFTGQFSDWRFAVDGVPHRIVYWRAPGAAAFDTTTFVRGIKGVVEQAVGLFGQAPWREYTFVFQDSAWGGLEHPASVTLGAPSADLARDPNAYLQETAHEFFHAWNLMRIRPLEYRTVDWKPQPQTAGLWFSEGLTIHYADLLQRRAGIRMRDSTRLAHLGSILQRYINQPGNTQISAERVSRAAYNSTPDALGDYLASTHLQGEVIGTMLDMQIRAATDGRNSIDDVMRLMLERSSRQFTSSDIEQTVEDVCRCDVTPFFDAHVRNGSPIDIKKHLALLGLKPRLTPQAMVGRDGAPMVDVGVGVYENASDKTLRIRIYSPENVWGRAGLHTGDRLFNVNGQAVANWPEFRGYLARLRVGDTLRLEIERSGKRVSVPVVGTQLVQSVVRVEPAPNSSERAVRLRTQWEAGK
jgi:predicted metalloprotease with PDZ domain